MNSPVTTTRYCHEVLHAEVAVSRLYSGFKRNEKPVIRQYLCFSLNNDGMLVPMYCNVDCTLSSLTLIPLTNTGKHNYFPQNATRCYGVQKGITWDDVTRDYTWSRPPAPSQPSSPLSTDHHICFTDSPPSAIREMIVPLLGLQMTIIGVLG